MKKLLLLLIWGLGLNQIQAQIDVKKTAQKSNSQTAPSSQIDPRAVEVLNVFMQELMVSDEEESVQQVIRYVHKSLWNADGTDLTPDIRRFSFKKARDNAKFYQVPVKITRIRPSNVSAIGLGETAEAGKVVDYFIAKKAGVNGMPAPVKIFFPADGSEPKISYMGSL
jgi:hypothetical protein